MQDQEVLEQLEELVLHLGLELRWEEGEFTGGICRLRGQEIFLVNRSLPTLEKIRILCRELSQADLSRTFVLPALRERIIQYTMEPG
ncbi:MAG: hypothetical protein IIB03_06920 [Acidobacteria bacterium]|jgi:hypothetical protein|nr:hypothetical protein [Acidobacteriota bacterium]